MIPFTFAPSWADPKTLTRQVWDSETARSIPAFGRGLDLISGLASQMPLDAWRGIDPLPRPRLLEQPDLDLDLATYVQVMVEDYIVHGNGASLITARAADHTPAAVKWFPAPQWFVQVDERTGRRRYYLNGNEVDAGNVTHVQNGADPLNPARGVGVVERYVRSLDRVGLQEERERTDLTGGQVPSVAVITPPGGDDTEDDLDAAATDWEAKFSGPGRRPAILPHGSQVVPLAWSPNDAEAQAARRASLTDVANMLNLDGYWLGAPASSHTYRTPGPLFLVLLRTTINRILTPFEQRFGAMWLPRGQRVVFDRSEVLGDDMKTTVETLTKATGRPIMTVNEARGRIRLAPIEGGNELATTPVPEDEPAPEDDDQLDDDQTPTPDGAGTEEGADA